MLTAENIHEFGGILATEYGHTQNAASTAPKTTPLIDDKKPP